MASKGDAACSALSHLSKYRQQGSGGAIERGLGLTLLCLSGELGGGILAPGTETQGDIRPGGQRPLRASLHSLGSHPRVLSSEHCVWWKAHSVLLKRPKSKTVFISRHLSKRFSPSPVSTSAIPLTRSLGQLIWLTFYQSKKIFFLRSKWDNKCILSFLHLEGTFLRQIPL